MEGKRVYSFRHGFSIIRIRTKYLCCLKDTAPQWEGGPASPFDPAGSETIAKAGEVSAGRRREQEAEPCLSYKNLSCRVLASFFTVPRTPRAMAASSKAKAIRIFMARLFKYNKDFFRYCTRQK